VKRGVRLTKPEEKLEIRKYRTADDFLKKNYKFLFENEAANNLIIGIANRLKSSAIKEDLLMRSIRDNKETLLVSVMTPPHDIVVASKEMDVLAIMLLVNDLIAQEIMVPGILAENAITDMFCEKWKEKTGDESKLFRRERVYQLLHCKNVEISSGQMRMAGETDIDQIAESFRCALQTESH